MRECRATSDAAIALYEANVTLLQRILASPSVLVDVIYGALVNDDEMLKYLPTVLNGVFSIT